MISHDFDGSNEVQVISIISEFSNENIKISRQARVSFIRQVDDIFFEDAYFLSRNSLQRCLTDAQATSALAV